MKQSIYGFTDLFCHFMASELEIKTLTNWQVVYIDMFLLQHSLLYQSVKVNLFTTLNGMY
jgi:hypothetical protein